MLLERDSFLTDLAQAGANAAAGQGCVVFVSGEAGMGKTTLVEAFGARLREDDARARVFWGACDALFTPRPLGPLHDIAHQAEGPLRELIRSGMDRELLFAAFLDEIARPGAVTLTVFEDVHWADEATLDLLKFVARRIRRTQGLLVLTFRDDEVDAAHPLRQLLGELPPNSVRRLHLPPLSREAVARLAAVAGRATGALWDVTGGNPFFVTEVLAADPERGVPPSVRDAVLARAARLDATTCAALDVVSIVPGHTERWLLDALLDDAERAIAAAVSAGLLRTTRSDVAFRHELARRAWEDALEPGSAAALHARVLRALQVHGKDPSLLPRLVHHADRSGDAATVLRLSPVAAREAAAVGAHREAAAHYESALRHAHASTPAERAALLDAWSYEVHLGGRMAEAVRAREESLTLWRNVGDQRRKGDALRWLSRLAWFEGRRADAAACADEAIRVLEPLGPSHELAMAYSTRAQLHILAEDRQHAAEWGERAVALAEALGDPEALVHALTNAACLEPGASREMQARAVRLAQDHGLHEHAMRAFAWLISDAVTEQDYALAEAFLEDGLAYADARDMDAYSLYLRGWRARVHLEQGRLGQAERDATEVLRRGNTSAVVRIPSLVVLGTVRIRRGERGGKPLLDEALEWALSTGELQRLAPVAIARAEAAWLVGDDALARTEVMRAWPLALRADSRWDIGRLALWLRRSGPLEPKELPALPAPFAASLEGRWQEAADAFERLGCPYERALALVNGDEPAQRLALNLLDEMGARPAAARLRARLVRQGVRGLPRGPRRSTRANPARLTRRQMDVLSLLAGGYSNREIGRRLFLSTRTVDHHVSALLRKLNAESRTAAARIAREMSIVSD